MGDCARRAQSSGEWPGWRLTWREGFLGIEVAVGGGMRPEEEAAPGGRRFGMGSAVRVGGVGEARAAVGETLRGLARVGIRPFVGSVGEARAAVGEVRAVVGEALRGLVREGIRPFRVGMRFVGGVGMRVAGGDGVLLFTARVGMRRAGEEAGRGMPEVRGLTFDFGRGGGGMRSDVPLVGVAGPSRFSCGVDTVGGSGDVCAGAASCWAGVGWGASSSLCSSTGSGEAGGGSKLKAGGGGILKEGGDGFSVAM